jgi:hypothetical protein
MVVDHQIITSVDGANYLIIYEDQNILPTI